ncbi:MAG: hypothetical protein H0W64_01190 [Gammaproteobacteria bacterium]|nr:hypothetical protein [Gammaproteobacteria bacterium]
MNKYIFENGVMKINPEFKAQQVNQGQPSTTNPNALAIVSSMDDVLVASEQQKRLTQRPIQLSDATTSSIDIMQSSDFTNKFQVGQMQSGDCIDGISKIFSQYEVPLGLVNKLLTLSQMGYKLNFIVDDSGSMGQPSNITVAEACPHLKMRLQNQGRPLNSPLSRWEEAEDRIHIMMDMLAFIPSKTVTVSFLNRPTSIILEHQGNSPAEFARMAHQRLDAEFQQAPYGLTPLYKKLSESLAQSTGNTMYYVYSDGIPSDGWRLNQQGMREIVNNVPTDQAIQQISELIITRANPQMNPITLNSCSNNDAEVAWLKKVDEDAPFTAEIDNFKAEMQEVQNDQGQAFPFSRGFWLLCQLAASINRDDLDAMDESKPFSKLTLDNMMGRKLSAEDYGHYFRFYPRAQQYQQYYNELARGDRTTNQILGNNNSNVPNQTMGYPSAPMPNNSNPMSGYNNSAQSFNPNPMQQGMNNGSQPYPGSAQPPYNNMPPQSQAGYNNQGYNNNPATMFNNNNRPATNPMQTPGFGNNPALMFNNNPANFNNNSAAPGNNNNNTAPGYYPPMPGYGR